jgi:hypothetical protein
MGNIVFLGLVLWATIGAVATTLEFATLGLQAPENRVGHVLFGTIVSLKVWVLLILLDFFVAIALPTWVADHREVIRFLLAVYLVLQTTGAYIAVRRYKATLRPAKEGD